MNLNKISYAGSAINC